ncbi:helix-turn-helix domain-containing protein [Halobium palmae]|uniref:Helix-turn-helix domain-containing protein n=1 Tax=Halobium palmae TaxID=1776492 RepID=A0ABD5RZZ7_9EURY
MAAEDSTDESGDGIEPDTGSDAPRGARDRLEESADRAVEEFDQSVVDLLAWLLDTETRARIYVHLRTNPDSTSSEIAEGTGLYPSTVREALAELHEEEFVTRDKRESSGAGNNPYEYEAIAPSTLVRGAVEQVQTQLNTVFNLDRRLSGDESDDGPVTITVDDGAFPDLGDSTAETTETTETAETDGGRRTAAGEDDEGSADD